MCKSSTPQSHIWFNTSHLPHAQAWQGRDAQQRRQVWWIHPPCLVLIPLTMQLFLVQQCKGKTGVKGLTRLVGLLSSVWQILKCWLLFLSEELLGPFRDNTLPQLGILFSDIYAEFLIPGLSLYQQSCHEVCFSPSEICICWTIPSKTFSSTCPLTLKKLRTAFKITSGSTCLSLPGFLCSSSLGQGSLLNLYGSNIWG